MYLRTEDRETAKTNTCPTSKYEVCSSKTVQRVLYVRISFENRLGL